MLNPKLNSVVNAVMTYSTLLALFSSFFILINQLFTQEYTNLRTWQFPMLLALYFDMLSL